jgi:hypothetical protein
MSCPNQVAKPHQNDPSSVAAGNDLLAEAHAATTRGRILQDQIKKLEEMMVQSYEEGTAKRGKAATLLMGTEYFRRGY